VYTEGIHAVRDDGASFIFVVVVIIHSDKGEQSTWFHLFLDGSSGRHCHFDCCLFLFEKITIHSNKNASHPRHKISFIEDRRRKSRLLQHQFGNINMEEHDLVLQEEETTPCHHKHHDDLFSADECRHDNKARNASGIHHRNRHNYTSKTNRSKSSFSTSTIISQQSVVSPTVLDQSAAPCSISSSSMTISDGPPPGSLEAFWHWCDLEASLFRIYTTVEDVPPPYPPSSRRGNVAIALQVTNHMPYLPIHVHWIEYNGTEVYRGVN
jgi:hypothetical protein